MTLPSRDEALATLEEGRAELAALLDRLDAERLVRAATIGGGDWSAKDLLGHVAYWEELGAQTVEEWRRGERPFVEQVFEGGEAGIDAVNARNQAHATLQSPEEVRTRAVDAHARIVEMIHGLSDEEWRAKAAYPTERRIRLVELLGSVLGAPKRPFGHVFAHLADLRTYVDAAAPAPAGDG